MQNPRPIRDSLLTDLNLQETGNLLAVTRQALYEMRDAIPKLRSYVEIEALVRTSFEIVQLREEVQRLYNVKFAAINKTVAEA